MWTRKLIWHSSVFTVQYSFNGRFEHDARFYKHYTGQSWLGDVKFANNYCSCLSVVSSELPEATVSLASCLHFIRLFWNHTLTWLSDNPSMDASWWRSAFVKYFWSWNRFSRPFLCRFENTARVQGLLGFLGFGWPGKTWPGIVLLRTVAL